LQWPPGSYCRLALGLDLGLVGPMEEKNSRRRQETKKPRNQPVARAWQFGFLRSPQIHWRPHNLPICQRWTLGKLAKAETKLLLFAKD
jgi:hypothetical protein